MITGSRKDPYASFNFIVEIDGLVAGGFMEVSGIQAETKVEEYREGGVNFFVHKFVKHTEYPNLVLKRGLTDSEILWDWHREVVWGTIKRKNGSIILLDESRNEKWRWNFFRALPLKWIGPDLKANSNMIAVETIELAHEGLYKV